MKNYSTCLLNRILIKIINALLKQNKRYKKKRKKKFVFVALKMLIVGGGRRRFIKTSNAYVSI
jgi:hypothetical protein